jgi:hypothetical protein
VYRAKVELHAILTTTPDGGEGVRSTNNIKETSFILSFLNTFTCVNTEAKVLHNPGFRTENQQKK